jgi:hypothetical protein
MVESQSSKLATRVRFPSPAQGHYQQKRPPHPIKEVVAVCCRAIHVPLPERHESATFFSCSRRRLAAPAAGPFLWQPEAHPGRAAWRLVPGRAVLAMEPSAHLIPATLTPKLQRHALAGLRQVSEMAETSSRPAVRGGHFRHLIDPHKGYHSAPRGQASQDQPAVPAQVAPVARRDRATPGRRDAGAVTREISRGDGHRAKDRHPNLLARRRPGLAGGGDYGAGRRVLRGVLRGMHRFTRELATAIPIAILSAARAPGDAFPGVEGRPPPGRASQLESPTFRWANGGLASGGHAHTVNG